MKQFLVLIKDFTDDDCINRRLSVREKHIKNNAMLKSSGKVLVLGGALTDKDSIMRASSLLCQADTPEQVREQLEKDIYVEAKVWDMSTFKIFEC
ncbi:hypothetical protein AYI70_g7494 [Smittium culicis]|uniref:YCII-related domain-containing protein n=1 Tax=Smittium culicis TaxID=133412 RepID=A0A1R1XD88_9FUNG|nr:hypothetical protein AYI70_g9013 [Smittium culicis]OMJ15094.1 hypothetical protein AYI70_g7494 [Smittium culicis]